MNEEIKITYPGQILDYVDTKEHLLQLFNYITNLADYKSRIDKAAEILKHDMDIIDLGDGYTTCEEVLNILEGSDKEWMNY